MPNNNMQNIIKTLEPLYGKYDRYQVLKDWFAYMAAWLEAPCLKAAGKDPEPALKEMDGIWERYGDSATAFKTAFFQLIDVMDEDVNADNYHDWLGEIFMQSCTASKERAQHFTPYSVSKCMAELNIGGKEAVKKLIAEQGYITINDPCVGGGSLIIAMLATLKEYGINYQQCAVVVCGDNDQRCCDMCFVQLQLLGAIATVENRNALTMELFQTRDTIFMVELKKQREEIKKVREVFQWLTPHSAGSTSASDQN